MESFATHEKRPTKAVNSLVYRYYRDFEARYQIKPGPLSTERQKEIIQGGDPVELELLFLSFLPYIVNIATRWVRRGADLDILVSAGRVGLMEAAQRFSDEYEANFLTYARFWISKEVRTTALSEQHLIRRPARAISNTTALHKALGKLGDDATDHELAQETSLTVKEVRRMRDRPVREVSLEAPLDDNGSTVADIVQDPGTQSPDLIMEFAENLDALGAWLKSLTERERIIITRRFGLDGTEPETLLSIANDIGVTRERVRQIEVVALNKMRKAARRRDAR